VQHTGIVRVGGVCRYAFLPPTCDPFIPYSATDPGAANATSSAPAGASQIFSDGMWLALLLGLLLGTATQLACGPLLANFYHLERGSEVSMQAAQYLRIRALAAPAATATLVGAGVAFGLSDAV